MKKEKINTITIFYFLLIFIILFITVGYSAFSESIKIDNIIAEVRLKKDIRLIDINVDSIVLNGMSNYEEYNYNSVLASVTLPNEDSSVTYKIKIANIEAIEMGIYDITGLPDNLEYTIAEYKLKDKICDENRCNLGIVKEIYITIKYKNDSYDSSNTRYDFELKFDFRQMYNIRYDGITNNNYKTSIISNDNLEIQFNEPIPYTVVPYIDGVKLKYEDYTYENGKLKINNITGDVVIKYAEKVYLALLPENKYFKESAYLTNIKTIQFVKKINIPIDKLASYDLSKNKDGSIVGWIDKEYNLYIGSDFNIYAESLENAFRGMSAVTKITFNNLNTSEMTSLYHTFDGMSSLTSLDVSHFDTRNVTNMSTVFKNCSKITTLDLSNWNTAKVTVMNVMFSGMTSLSTLDLSNFNTSNVTKMHEMFYGCKNLITLDISNFNTTKVESMYNMFCNCSSLTSLDLSHFDTGKVTLMSSMFNGMSSLTSLNISNFNTSNVTNMSTMFANCSNLTTLDLSSFNTSNVTTMKWLFVNCKKLTNLNISSFNTAKVTDMYEMFSNCSSLTSLDLRHFNTSNVTTMYAMFYNCSSLTTLDISGFNTSNVTVMGTMFHACNKLTVLDLSSFNTSKVTNMSIMFNAMTKLKTIYVSDKWTTSAVTTSTDMFTGSTSLVGGMGTTYNSSYIDKTYARIDNKPSSPGYFSTKKTNTISYVLNGGTVSGTNVTSLDYGASTTLIVPTKSGYKFTGWTVSSGLLSGNTFTMGNSNVTITANFVPIVVQAIYSATDNSLTFINDVSQTKGGTYNGKVVTEVYTGFTTTNYSETTIPWYSYRGVIKKVDVIDEISPTSLAHWFNGLSACTEMNLKKLNTSKVTSMILMFNNCSSLTTLDLSNFDTSKVTEMYSMFSGCSKLTTLDLSSFDTSNVTKMYNMFLNCNSLTSLNVSSFNTSKVTSMNVMFHNCWKLTSLDLSNFDTSSLVSLPNMFNRTAENASSFTLKLGDKFNTSKVTDMNNLFYYMCYNATTCSIDLGSAFNTSNVTNMSYMFNYTGYNSTTCSINLGPSFDTSKVTDMSSMFNRACSFSTTTTINLGNKFDTSNVTSMSGMFAKVARNNPNFVLDLSSFNTSKVTDMSNMFNGITKLKTIYVGDKWTTSAVTTSTDMFTGSTSLVGGLGTTYSSSYIDKTYARIDTTGAPGYFTYKASS